MHQHDIDLIQALAEGELTGHAAETAADAISACPQCSRDLDLQVRALEALREAPRAYLSAAESTRLRTAVRRDLKLGARPETTYQLKRPRLRMGALAGAAVVLFAVVVIAPQLDLLGSGDEDAALPLEELGEALSSPAVADDTSAPVEVAAAPAPATQAEADAAVEEVPGEERTSLAAAEPQAAIAAPPELAGDIDLEKLRELYIDQDGILSLEAYQSAGLLADDATAAIADTAEAAEGAGRVASPWNFAIPCDPESVPGVTTDAETRVLGVTTYRETPAVVVAYLDGDPADVVIVVHDAATCEVLDRS